MNNDSFPDAFWRLGGISDTIPSSAAFDINWSPQFGPSVPKVRVRGNGNVAIGSFTTDHPLEIHSGDTDTSVADVVLALVADSTNRPTIAFAERTPVGAAAGMYIEYDGRIPNSSIRQRLNFLNEASQVVHSFDMGGSATFGTPETNYPATIKVYSGGGTDAFEIWSNTGSVKGIAFS